ncbi:MAG: cupin domain-containing protein [Actinomycetota bacterium]
MDTGDIIKRFNMKPLPDEGGYFAETYRCPQLIKKKDLSPGYGGARNLSTAILYLVTEKHFSHLHRVKSDEVFHFYTGDPVCMLNLYGEGNAEKVMLGTGIMEGQRVQHLVPGGTWQGAYLREGGRFALLGTTVSPGFDFSDYQSGRKFRDKLIKEYPGYEESIERLT